MLNKQPENCKKLLDCHQNHPKEITDALDKTIIAALLEERHRCADVAFESFKEDQVKAKYIVDEIRRVNKLLVSNLSSMR